MSSHVRLSGQTLRYFLLAVAGALLFSFVSLQMSFSYLDTLFLDLRLYLTRPVWSDQHVIGLNISDLKKNGSSTFSAKALEETLAKISKSNPKLIVLAFAPNEIEGTESERKHLARKLESFSNVYLYSRWGQEAGKSFAETEEFKSFSRSLSHKFTIDNKVGGFDGRTRRLVLSMNGKNYDEDFVELTRVFGANLSSLDELPGTFVLYDSRQVFLRFYESGSLPIYLYNESFDHSVVRGKTVVIGTADALNTYTARHVFGRFERDSFASLKSMLNEVEYLLTVYGNMKERSYVLKVPSWVNFSWIFTAVLLQILVLWKYGTGRKLWISFLVPLAIFSLELILFGLFRLEFDFSRIVVGSILIQYVGAPLLYLRHLRKLDNERLEKDKQLELARVHSKLIVKSARADLNFKIAAKVSHDIRAPLMALQVGLSVIKGKVSEDVESLMKESTERLKYIADDVLETYRTGPKFVGSAEPSESLKEIVASLVKTFRMLSPQVTFVENVPAGFFTNVPSLSLQRALSNLLKNSVEALMAQGSNSAKIEISAQEEGDQLVIEVRDNGPGIPKELESNLFREKSTHGKSGGTGLGLFQVRQEMEVYGGIVKHIPQPIKGACFQIRMPKQLEKIPIYVSAYVLVVETEDEIWNSLNASKDSEVILQKAKGVKEAILAIEQHPERNWTIFTDLILPSDDETGFDLIEKAQGLRVEKLIMCTVLAEHEEVKELALKYNTILIKRNLLPQLALKNIAQK